MAIRYLEFLQWNFSFALPLILEFESPRVTCRDGIIMLMSEVIAYCLRLLPGLALLTSLYFLYNGKRAVAVRILLLILSFILMRDTMTRAGFWQFGVADGFVPWIRFINDPLIVGTLGLASLLVTLFVIKASNQMRPYLKWGDMTLKTGLWGVVGATAIALPFVIIYQLIPVAERGSEVAPTLLPALLCIVLLGNFMEEVLFRGYLQGYLEKLYTPLRAAVLSALTFAAGHVFLAITVTDLGIVIIAFALYEGLVCAFLRMRFGIWPAVIAHGLGVFVLASGMF